MKSMKHMDGCDVNINRCKIMINNKIIIKMCKEDGPLCLIVNSSRSQGLIEKKKKKKGGRQIILFVQVSM